MERLWAPWRMVYIKNKDKNKVCVLCLRSRTKHPDGELVLAQSKYSFVILNKYPYISGHLMVVPKRHTAKLEDLSAPEGADLFCLLQKTVKRLKKSFKPHGLNLGLNLGRSAGAGLTGHLHFHVVPRWNGDTNFMPIIGETKVISEDLKKTATKLAPYFKNL